MLNNYFEIKLIFAGMNTYNSIRILQKEEKIPYELLLLADPSKVVIDQYLGHSSIYIAEHNGNIHGLYVLTPIDSANTEIRNIAVAEQQQGKGLGKLLLAHAESNARDMGYKSLHIGTANSSIGQLCLYQKAGFDIVGIKPDFFIKNYMEEIWENGIRARHMILLTKDL